MTHEPSGRGVAVEAIDDVHVEVADRDASADWYGRVLGLKRDERYAMWASDPAGPLILSTIGGASALALFARSPAPASRDSTIAFRVSGEAFVALCGALASLDLRHRTGRALTAADVVDHGVARSLYFLDPDQNPIELTTYDIAHVENA